MTLSEHDLERFSAFERSGWEQAAKRYHEHWGDLSKQSTDHLLNAAKVGSGSKVLDVATGAGYLASAAVERGADAIGVDFVDAQVDLARRLNPGLKFQKGDAENLPFDTGIFDAVVIGFGVNHLPHPETAFAEAFRVLKNGGHFGFTVWAPPDQSQGFGIVLEAIELLGTLDAKFPPAPPYFRFADPDEVQRVCREIGFVDAMTQIIPLTWYHQSPDDLFEAFNEGAVRATAMLLAQSNDIRERIRQQVREQVKRLKRDGRYVIEVPAALSVARKP